MVLFSALLKMHDMTLKMLLNSFMPRYPPIYKMDLQRLFALLKGCSCASVILLCAKKKQKIGVIIIGDSRLDGVRLRFHPVIPTIVFFLY